MIYSSLLHILSNKDNYYKYIQYILPHIVPKEIYDIISSMKPYYKLNPTLSDINFDSFITWYKIHKISSLSKEKHAIYDKIFDTLQGTPPTDDEMLRVLDVLIEKDHAIKISDIALKVSEGDDTKSILDVEPLLEDYKRESDRVANADAIFADFSLDDVLDNHTRPGLDWRLDELNKSLGPLRAGDFMIVTARPDSGKTTFLCSESTYMASQLPLEKDVFWANNEELGSKVTQRIFQAALGDTKSNMRVDKLATKRRLEAALGRMDRFKMYDDKAMTVGGVNNALSKCNPGLIIFDQLWKVAGFPDAHNDVDKITKLFAWGRELAEKYSCPVVSVHQADGSASGEPYIQMNQMYGSKTGIQGEADAILGIGRSFDPSVAENTRFLHISKNKLDGGSMSDEKERNGKWMVEIQPYIARFKGSVL